MLTHPSPKQLLDKLIAQCSFSTGCIEELNVAEVKDGIFLEQTRDFRCEYQHGAHPYQANFPNGISVTEDEAFLFCSREPLNEFGFIYVGLYMAGMMSRYYPDIWMKHLEQSTETAVALTNFLEVVKDRAPLLMLAELEENVILPVR